MVHAYMAFWRPTVLLVMPPPLLTAGAPHVTLPLPPQVLCSRMKILAMPLVNVVAPAAGHGPVVSHTVQCLSKRRFDTAPDAAALVSVKAPCCSPQCNLTMEVSRG